MATVIDSLLVTLGLDDKQFKQGTKEATKAQEEFAKKTEREGHRRERSEKKLHSERAKNTKQFVRQGKEAIDVYRKIRNELLGIAAIAGVGGGLLEFAKHTITGAANLHFAARDLGVSVKHLAGLQGALKVVGGHAGSAESLLSAVNKPAQMNAAAQPAVDFMRTLGLLGFKGNYRKDIQHPIKFLDDLAEAVKSYSAKHGAKNAIGLVERLGISKSGFDFLMQRKSPSEQIAHYGALSGESAKRAAQAQRLRRQFENIAQSFTGAMQTVVFGMQPLIKKVEDYANNLAKSVVKHQGDIVQFMKHFATDVEKLGPKLKTAGDDAMILVKALAKLIHFFDEIGIGLGVGAARATHDKTGALNTTGKVLSGIGTGAVHGPQGKLLSEMERAGNVLWGFVPGSRQNREFVHAFTRGLKVGKRSYPGSVLWGIQTIHHGAPSSVRNSTTTTAHVQNVNINTPATDGRGIMQDLMFGAVFPYVPQSDGALQ